MSPPDKEAPGVDKRKQTARARSALRGIALHIIDGDNGRPLYIANLHALTKCFDDLAEVERWLDRIGAPK